MSTGAAVTCIGKDCQNLEDFLNREEKRNSRSAYFPHIMTEHRRRPIGNGAKGPPIGYREGQCNIFKPLSYIANQDDMEHTFQRASFITNIMLVKSAGQPTSSHCDSTSLFSSPTVQRIYLPSKPSKIYRKTIYQQTKPIARNARTSPIMPSSRQPVLLLRHAVLDS